MKLNRFNKPALLAMAAVMSSAVLAACGSSGTPAGSEQRPSSNAQYNDADITFATDMIGHHRQAVEMASMVLMRGTTPSVRALATRIKNAQQPEITELTAFLVTFGQPVPDATMGMQHMSGHNAMGMMSADEMDALESLSGRALEKQFLTDMIEHHAGAVMMSNNETTKGKYAPAKALAQKIISAQTAEITEMRSLLKTYA